MKNYKNIVAVLLMILNSVQLFAEGNQKNKTTKMNKTNGQPEYAQFNINKISTWIKNDGEADINPGGNIGFLFPKESNKGAFFQSGFLYGGIVDGEIRIGGSTYNQGQVPGRILEDGSSEDRNLSHVRIYRVRRDYKTADLSHELLVRDTTINNNLTYITYKSVSESYKQYEKDWNEWPAEFGAPFEDIDKNGIYEPEIDIPGEPGADQTIWFVCNDLDLTQAKTLFGSPPIGIEMQTTVYGYNKIPVYSNTVFKKYKLINKSGKDIKEMFVAMWSDPDLGDATDDYYGCDTTLNMMYVYNGYDNDATYGFNVPAAGFKLLKGPKVNNKNLGMTSFIGFKKSSPDFDDPNVGNYEHGGLVAYNYFQGKTQYGKSLFQAPAFLGGYYTKFTDSGNPVTGEGWIDGILSPPGDRRMMMSSGPFELAIGDTQAILFSQFIAGGNENVDRLQSVTILKKFSTLQDQYFNQLSNLNKANVISNIANNNVVLKWGDSNSKIIENYSDGNHSFQGYNIYQLPSINSSIEEYVRIKTFDKNDGIKSILEEFYNEKKDLFELKVKQFGTDSGLQRFFEIKKDYINNTTLKNGTSYYFAIGSYFIGDPEFTFFNNYETYSDPIKVIPHNPNPGIKYESEIGDTISVAHFRGTAEANVNIIVVDPSEVNGHQYEISFKKNNENKIVWELDDVTENKTVLSNQTNITGTDEYIIVDGIRIVITQNENIPISENDLYRFTTPKVIYDEEQAKFDVEKINVFPNPYYGYSSLETQKLGNFVMINHLPKKAVIRIFNLAGHLVRTLHKDSDSQFYLWDLQNEHQVLAASGLYILHIEMPDLGKVKVLKLAIILGTEVPDFY